MDSIPRWLQWWQLLHKSVDYPKFTQLVRGCRLGMALGLSVEAGLMVSQEGENMSDSIAENLWRRTSLEIRRWNYGHTGHIQTVGACDGDMVGGPKVGNELEPRSTCWNCGYLRRPEGLTLSSTDECCSWGGRHRRRDHRRHSQKEMLLGTEEGVAGFE
jgi:hypothetical protein